MRRLYQLIACYLIVASFSLVCVTAVGFLGNNIGIIRPKAFRKDNNTAIDEAVVSILNPENGSATGKFQRWDLHVLGNEDEQSCTPAMCITASEVVSSLCDIVLIEIDCRTGFQSESDISSLCEGLKAGIDRRIKASSNSNETDVMLCIICGSEIDSDHAKYVRSKIVADIFDGIDDTSTPIHIFQNCLEIENLRSSIYVGRENTMGCDNLNMDAEEFAKFMEIIFNEMIASRHESKNQTNNMFVNFFDFSDYESISPLLTASLDSDILAVQKIQKDVSADEVKAVDSLLSENIDEEISAIVETLCADLQALEYKQEDASLDSNRPPLLEFGQEASHIFNRWKAKFEQLKYQKSGETLKRIESFQSSINDQYIVGDSSLSLVSLFSQHLLSLRDHFGQKYETSLAEIFANCDERDDRERRKTAVASQAIDGFKIAAKYAIPNALVNANIFNQKIDEILEGLIRDLMSITEDQQIIEDDWTNTIDFEENNGDDGSGLDVAENKPPKWYKKLAARILVLGINYCQGLIVLHGLRKAAAERDQIMPKFPLF